MILPNRILLFLIGCTIAAPCFGDACPVEGWVANYCNHAEECTCTIESITSCPYSLPNCNKLTIQVVILDEKTVCDDDNYIAYCNNVELNLSYILNTLKNNRHRLKDKCWAVDGSLTTNQHYQNMRELFNSNTYSDGIIEDAIVRMDLNSRKSEVDGGCDSNADCDSSNTNDINSSKCALKLWRDMTHVACANAMNQPGGVTCTKCPDKGKTPKPTVFVNKVKFTVTAITSGEDNTPLQVPSISDQEIVDSWWKSFNTIADCYITQGTDERGEFKLNATTDKCYYSKE